MKKLLLFSLIVVTTAAFAQTADNEIGQTAAALVEAANELKGQSFTIDSKIIQKGLELKAKMLRMGASELEKMANQLTNEDLQDKYYEVIAELRKLSTSLRKLEVPNMKFTKTLENFNKHLELEAKLAGLKAQGFKEIIQQVKDPNLKATLQKAMNHKEEWSKAILQNLEQNKEEKAGPTEEDIEIELLEDQMNEQE